MDDMRAKGRAKGRDPYVGENHVKAKLTEEKVLRIVQLLEEKRHPQTKIAEMFGVNKNTISEIKYGRTWNYLTQRSSQRAPEQKELDPVKELAFERRRGDCHE
jgi:DNA invertase Pin-like site-specific DNA recombinase